MSSKAAHKKPCRFYKAPQGCTNGDQCKFLHDDGAARQALVPSAKTPRTQTNDFNSWLYLTPRHQSAARLGPRLQWFFKKALGLVLRDDGIRQAVVTKLASEGGLACINELVEKVEVNSENPQITRTAIFEGHVLPLLRILAHQDVLSSLVLETFITTIFNFVFGPAGRRAVILFEFVAHVLETASNSPPDTSAFQPDLALEASAVTFAKTVELNGSAPLIGELQPVLKALVASLEVLKTENTPSVRRTEKHLHRANKRLGCLGDIPIAHKRSEAIRIKPSFKLQRDGPGDLSPDGRRHDNDSENITQIQIISTADEVQCRRSEYLPTIDSSEHHVHGLKGLRDRQFRLLRKDTVGQLLDAVRIERDRSNQSKGSIDNSSGHAAQTQAARTFVYKNAHLQDLTFHKSRGLDLVYEFAQPDQVRTKSATDRREWWQTSKRLQHGALVCLLDRNVSPVFCSVSATGLLDDLEKPRHEATEDSQALGGYNVFDHPEKASVILSLVKTDEPNLLAVLDGFVRGHGRGHEDLIEFSGILLQSFQPTLEALQRMVETKDMPFADIIASDVPLHTGAPHVDPPNYATTEGFRFDLSCLNLDKSALSFRPGEDFDVKKLVEKTTFDLAQANSVVDALSRKLALIQGPPGTGKSFTGVSIIKVLLEAQKRTRLGPILTVCYTNHALDQLLENLVGEGVEQIIRIGSRSKFEMLQDLNLRLVASKVDNTQTERRRLWQCREKMKAHLQWLNILLAEFGRAASAASVQKYLAMRNRSHFGELFEEEAVDEEGWKKVQYARDPLLEWLQGEHRERSGTVPRPLEDLEHVPLFLMSSTERQLLYADWISDIRSRGRSDILSILGHFIAGKSDIEDARQERDRRCLQQASVIGVTTSGLARIMKLLQRLEIKVVLCEEAGEVLEAHTLATFLPSIEHAIFIGDHRQLRPHVQNYELSCENYRGKHFSLDVSLFERLVQPPKDGGLNFPFSSLEVQRRMRPSISDLIRSTSYAALKDHHYVKTYPEVSGML